MLIQEIELLRHNLNFLVIENIDNITSEQLVKLSQKLVLY